jgi:large subunit ribosomal protein L5
MAKSRLEEHYKAVLRPQLQKKLEVGNIMQVPQIKKIVLNVGVKEAVSDSKALQVVAQVLSTISGQMPVRTSARKSIAGFKIREGMQLGVMVTLRRQKMYEFLDKLINLALPKVRDFQGVPTRLDGQGNYNLGIKDWTIFPEAESLPSDKSYGMNITIQTSAMDDKQGLELLKSFGMPFRK